MRTLLKMDRLILIVGLLVVMQFCSFANGNFVFPVERKFKSPYSSLVAVKDHDSHRRGRFLSSAADLPLGGHDLANSTGLYYTKLGLGSPAKDFYVQVDTGSDILWVNCVGGTTCPKTTRRGLHLTLYDPNDSKTSDLVSCDDDFCTSAHDGPISSCKQDMSCPYNIFYGDGSTTSGAFIKDYLPFNRINGNLRTMPENGTVIFGCSAKQSEKFSLDGIMGFGQANTYVLSQLAASGKVKRIFSHCLDSINGGGIFSIGEVVAPKFNTTPLVPKMSINFALYTVVLKVIEVDGEAIQLPMDIFHIENGGATIIDSGTALAYLPASIYDQLVSKIFARQPGLKFYLVEDEFTCFHYSNNSDDGFPLVKLYFEGLSLTVHPHDYLFVYKEDQDDMWCIGWQRLTPIKGRKYSILLGGSTSIKVKDDETGSVYKVGAQHISFPPASNQCFLQLPQC